MFSLFLKAIKVNGLHVDTHIHVDGMSEDELRYMVSNNINRAITCAFYPVEPKYQQTFIDLFRRMINFDVLQAEKVGLTLYVAVGIHPRSIPQTGYEMVIESMNSLIEHNLVVAFGETGLQNGSTKEIEVLRAQIELAKEHGFPIIVHTPGDKKLEITEKILPLINKTRINPELVVIDHVNAESIPIIDKSGYNIGLSVQYNMLTPECASELIIQYSDNNDIVLNSDNGFRKCDIASVAKTIESLGAFEVEKSLLEHVSHKNAENIFKL